MSETNVIDFLRLVASRVDIHDSLKVKSKDEVISAAAAFGYPFSGPEFDSLIWDLEVQLAEKRGEVFDAHLPLWETMWGTYYLTYLVRDLVPIFEEAGLLKESE
jgi:hypothetical protein